MIEVRSTPYIDPYCATIVLRVTSSNNHYGKSMCPVKTTLTTNNRNISNHKLNNKYNL
jgi:hypothetical protein